MLEDHPVIKEFLKWLYDPQPHGWPTYASYTGLEGLEFRRSLEGEHPHVVETWKPGDEEACGQICLDCGCSNHQPCGEGNCPHCGPWASGRQIGWIPQKTWGFRCDAQTLEGDCHWSHLSEGGDPPNPCGEAKKCLKGRDDYYGCAGKELKTTCT